MENYRSDISDCSLEKMLRSTLKEKGMDNLLKTSHVSRHRPSSRDKLAFCLAKHGCYCPKPKGGHGITRAGVFDPGT